MEVEIMKEFYISPELNVVCFASTQNLANLDFGTLLGGSGSGNTDPASINDNDIDIDLGL